MAGEAVTTPAAASVSSSVSGRPAPQLKGRHAAYMKRHLFIGIGLAISGVIVAKLLINDPRKRAYAEYYK